MASELHHNREMEIKPKYKRHLSLAALAFGWCILFVFGMPASVRAEEGMFDLFGEAGEEFLPQDDSDDQALQVKSKFEADYVRGLKTNSPSEPTAVVRAQVFHRVYSDYINQTRSMPSGKIRKAFSNALAAIGNDLIKHNTWPDGQRSDFAPTEVLEMLQLVAKVPGQKAFASELIHSTIPSIYSQVDPKTAFSLFHRAHRDSSEGEREDAFRTLLRIEPSNIYSIAEYIVSLEKKDPVLHQQLIGLMQKMSRALPYAADSSFRAWARPEFFAAISSGCTGECFFEQLNVSPRGFHHHFRNALDSVPRAIEKGKLGIAVRMIRNLSDIAYKNRNDLFYADRFAELTELNVKLPLELRLDLLQDSIDKTAEKIYRDTPELQEVANKAVTIRGTVARALGEPTCHPFFRKLAYTPEVYAKNRRTLLVAGGAVVAVSAGIGIHSSVSSQKDVPRGQEEAPRLIPEPVVREQSIQPAATVEAHPISKKWKEFLSKISFSSALSEHRIRQQILDGSQPDFDLVTQTVWDKYLKAYQENSDRPLQYLELKNVRQLMLREIAPGADAVTFKLGLEEKLRDVHPNGLIYNQRYTNPISTLIDGKDQCSATSICRDLLFRQHLGQKAYEDARPVYILEKGHVLNGLVTASGELLGLEGTVSGSALKKYGKISELKDKAFAIRVVDAEDYLLAELFARYLSPQDQERLRAVLLQTTAQKFKLPLLEMERRVSKVSPGALALNPHSALNQSLFSFGSPDPVEGDVERMKAEEVSTEKAGVPAAPASPKPSSAEAELSPPPPALPESIDVEKAMPGEAASVPKLLPGRIVPLSALSQRLAEDLDQIYANSKWNSDRILVRYGSAALAYSEYLSPETEEQVRLTNSYKVFYEGLFNSENDSLSSEGFEKLCRIVGDPSFSEQDRISALVQLMSQEKKQTEETLRQVQERLPNLYMAAKERMKK